jgi:hypothetical protein
VVDLRCVLAGERDVTAVFAWLWVGAMVYIVLRTACFIWDELS